jgi:hypothetical protein
VCHADPGVDLLSVAPAAAQASARLWDRPGFAVAYPARRTIYVSESAVLGATAMTKELESLVERARKVEMTPTELREQRQSFVYGNTHIENDVITREMVAEADRKIEIEAQK